MRLFKNEGLERLVVKLVLQEASERLNEEERERIRAIQNAVQVGVARAFGGR